MLDQCRQTPAHGLVAPCLFDDIQEMTACHAHAKNNAKGKSRMPSACPVGDIDILICSTSCKDYSKMNSNRMAGSIINARETAQTLHGLNILIKKLRPAMIFFDNTEVARVSQIPVKNVHCCLG